MLSFSIDMGDTISEFSLGREETDSLCDYTLDRVVDEFMTQWETLINGDLRNTRDEYKKGIYTERPDPRTAIIGLNGREAKLAMMIEEGHEAFDEKAGFAASEKRHVKDDGEGWWLTIPFRHASSEAIMSMKVPGEEITVQDLMKQGATLGPEDLPAPFDETLTHSLQLNNGSVISYRHKAPIYEGMKRENINSVVTERRGGYFTFRTVSDKSDPEAFIHPGFTARKFMDRALNSDKLLKAADAAIQEWLDRKFG